MSQRQMRLSIAAALLLGLAACGPAVPERTPTLPPTVGPRVTAALPPSPTTTASATAVPMTPTVTTEPTPDLSWLTGLPAAEADYTVPLMTRHVTSGSATLQFSLAQAETAELVVWPAGVSAEPQHIPLGERADGLVTVEGLSAGTAYSAALLVGEPPGRPGFDSGNWPPILFTTQSDAGYPFRIAVVGDSGFGEEKTAALIERMAAAAPDAVIHTGDLVYKIDEDPDAPTAFIEKLFRPFAPVLRTAPFYPVPGNHDLEAAARWGDSTYYFTAFPVLDGGGVTTPAESDGGWYSFSYGDLQFVMLNSQAVFGFGRYQAETDWLAERVADPAYRATIVVLHIPPHNAGRHRTDSSIIRSRWGDLLGAPSVVLVLAGHDHNYQRFENDGVVTIVTGGGSQSLYSINSDAEGLLASERRTHFTLLDVGNDAIQLQAVGVDGVVFDQASIQLPSE